MYDWRRLGFVAGLWVGVGVGVGGGVLGGARLSAQQEVLPPMPALDTVTVVPGPEYRAGWLRRFSLGDSYRNVWTTPIRVPVIDLDRFGGGLTLIKRGGGGETWSIKMQDAAGNEWALRSVDKHTDKLPPDIRGGLVQKILQDQYSNGFATGALLIGPLYTAAGVLHEPSRLAVLPNSPRLGQYQKTFAGLLVLVEGRPRGVDDEEGGGGAQDFQGASKIAKTDKMLAAINGSPSERFDSREYLTARLMDIYIGDWDRGPWQWWWARFGGKGEHVWRAIPHDHDWAFANFTGLLYDAVRDDIPWFVEFDQHYANILGLEAQAWGSDRRLLQDLDRKTWDSTANWLRGAITDSVIRQAVAALPPEQQAVIGPTLVRNLRARRDRFPEMAEKFYLRVAGQADVHTIGVPSVVEISRQPDAVEIRASVRGDAGAAPYYDRRFVGPETRELRLYLDGGPDSVIVHGGGDDMTTRLIASGDGDVLVDSAGAGAGPTRVYDGGHPVRVAAGIPETIDTRLYKPPPFDSGFEPQLSPIAFLQRDAGARCITNLSGGASSNAGLLVAGGPICDTYGFRRLPFETQHVPTIGYIFGPGGIYGDYVGSLRMTGGSPVYSVHAQAISAVYTWFYGVGNETTHHLPNNDYRARQSHFLLTPTVAFWPSDVLSISVGPELRYTDTEQYPKYFAETRPYGGGPFGIFDGHFDAVYDSRLASSAPTQGLRFELSGRAVPAVWDVTSAYGSAHAEAAGFTTLQHVPLTPILALRVGGDKVWGAGGTDQTVPYQDLARIGGVGTVRGFYYGRFTGDAALYSNAELFLTLAHVVIIAPADFGVLGLNDVGRVFVSGQNSAGWHDAYGGGVWTAFLNRQYLITVSIAHSSELTSIYAGFGIGW